jgi:hypothetical protein
MPSKDVFGQMNSVDALMLAAKYRASIAGVALVVPLTSVLPLGVWTPLISKFKGVLL